MLLCHARGVLASGCGCMYVWTPFTPDRQSVDRGGRGGGWWRGAVTARPCDQSPGLVRGGGLGWSTSDTPTRLPRTCQVSEGQRWPQNGAPPPSSWAITQVPAAETWKLAKPAKGGIQARGGERGGISERGPAGNGRGRGGVPRRHPKRGPPATRKIERQTGCPVGRRDTPSRSWIVGAPQLGGAPPGRPPSSRAGGRGPGRLHSHPGCLSRGAAARPGWAQKTHGFGGGAVRAARWAGGGTGAAAPSVDRGKRSSNQGGNRGRGPARPCRRPLSAISVRTPGRRCAREGVQAG